MKQVDLVEILRSRETYDKDHSTISIYDALEAMKEACNQAIDLCAENAILGYDRILVDDPKEGDEAYKNFPKVNKQSILDTKKQII